MTVEFLSSVTGALLSLVFSYLPGVEGWYQKLEPVHKRLVMLGLLALTSLAIFGLGCTSWANALGIPIACSQDGAIALLRVFITALVVNQSTYLISKK
jgi:hypothetical protein